MDPALIIECYTRTPLQRLRVAPKIGREELDGFLLLHFFIGGLAAILCHRLISSIYFARSFRFMPYLLVRRGRRRSHGMEGATTWSF